MCGVDNLIRGYVTGGGLYHAVIVYYSTDLYREEICDSMSGSISRLTIDHSMLNAGYLMTIRYDTDSLTG